MTEPKTLSMAQHIALLKRLDFLLNGLRNLYDDPKKEWCPYTMFIEVHKQVKDAIKMAK